MRQFVVNYTEEAFPLDAVKRNEGYVLGEILRKSGLDHIVVATGDTPSKIFNKSHYDQHSLGAKCFGAEVLFKYNSGGSVSPGDGVFDFGQTQFRKGYLEDKLKEHDGITIAFHSVKPAKLSRMTSQIEELKGRFGDKVKVVYVAHSDYDTHDTASGKDPKEEYLRFLEAVDTIAYFGSTLPDYVSQFQQKSRKAELGVDTGTVLRTDKTKGHLVIGCGIYSSNGRPVVRDILRNHLGAGSNSIAIVDFSEEQYYSQKSRFRTEFPSTYGIKVIPAMDLSYLGAEDPKLQLGEGPLPLELFSKADVFLYPDNTDQVHHSVLLALMHGVPVIAARTSANEEILNTGNSVLVEDTWEDRRHTKGFDEKTIGNYLAALKAFRTKNFDPEKIKQELVSSGRTSSVMVKAVDEILS